MSDLTFSSQNGIEYFSLNSTGESGISQTSLARCAGVTEETFISLINSLQKQSPSQFLEAFTGKKLEDLTIPNGAEYNNVTILKDTFCAAVLAHYAQQGKVEAAVSLGAFAAVGIRAYIHQITGWRPSVEAKLPTTYEEAILALVAAEEEKQRLASKATQAEQKIVELTYKAEIYDIISSSGKCLTMRDAAKVIGVIGRNKLFQFLRDEEVLNTDNLPYQKFLEQKYFIVVEQPAFNGIYLTTLVTQLGLEYIIRLLQKAGYNISKTAA